MRPSSASRAAGLIKEPIDIVGVLLSIVGLTLLTYGVIEGGDHGFGKIQSWGTLVASVVVLAAFNTGSDLPRGAQRLARLHVYEPSASAAYDIRVVVATSADGDAITATAALVPEEGDAR